MYWKWLGGPWVAASWFQELYLQNFCANLSGDTQPQKVRLVIRIVSGEMWKQTHQAKPDVVLGDLMLSFPIYLIHEVLHFFHRQSLPGLEGTCLLMSVRGDDTGESVCNFVAGEVLELPFFVASTCFFLCHWLSGKLMIIFNLDHSLNQWHMLVEWMKITKKAILSIKCSFCNQWWSSNDCLMFHIVGLIIPNYTTISYHGIIIRLWCCCH